MARPQEMCKLHLPKSQYFNNKLIWILTALPDNPDTHCFSGQNFIFNLWDTFKAVCKNLLLISVLTAILNWLKGKT